jgi:hypothetical protein
VIVAGGYMIWRGAQGDTKIQVLGANISTQNAGVACIGFGVLLLLFVLRPLIQAVVDLGRIPN